MVPIRRLLLRELITLVALVAPLGFGLAALGLGGIVGQQAALRASESLVHLQGQLVDRLQAIEATGTLLAQQLREGFLDVDRPEQAHRLLFALQKGLPQVTTLIFTRADGVSFSQQRLPGQLRWVRIVPTATGSTFEAHTHDEDGRQRGAPQVTADDYRPLQRPWVLQAQARGRPGWSDVYQYQDGLPGMTYTVPVFDDAEKLLGYVGLDLRLVDLVALARELRPTPLSAVAILDPQDRLLAAPLPPQATPDELRAVLLARPDAARFPVLHALLHRGPEASPGRWAGLAARLSAALGAEQPAEPFSGIEAAHDSWLGRIYPLERLGQLQWRLALYFPESELLGKVQRQLLVVALAVLLVTGLLAWRLLAIARLLASPLLQLSKAAEEVGAGKSPALPKTRVLEVQRLSEALSFAAKTLAEHARLQQRLLRSQRVEMVGTLASGIAHDVNNQLTAILGQIELGASALPDDHPARESLELAERATLRCAEVTRGLLSFSREVAPTLRSIDLAQLVRDTARLFGRVLGGQVTIELDLPATLPPVKADAVQLEQVLLNLALNARDAMPAGGVLRLKARLGDDGLVHLSVQDNGQGMSNEVLQRIFDPFFTTKQPGKGTGLGLSMAFNIVKAHGGHIEVQSEPGHGSTFTLLLPVAATPPEGVQPVSHLLARGVLSGRRILVVEDEEGVRSLLTHLLGESGAEVVCAVDGEEGLRLFTGAEKPFDLVITDQRMPRLSGLELVERLRARGAEEPVVLTTGYSLDRFESRDPLLRLLAKPFQAAELLKVLQELLSLTKGRTGSAPGVSAAAALPTAAE